MGIPVGFDLDLLRSFVAIAEERSFTRAAARVGRTQSAVSLQMQRLEGVLGQTVIVRGKGGSVELNPEGQYLLGRARELLALNDDIMQSLHAAPVHGTIRLGIPAELSARFLPRILDRFSHAAPAVEVEVEVSDLRKGRLLAPGRRGELTWNVGGRPSSSIGIFTEEGSLELTYHRRGPAQEWLHVHEVIALDSTEQHFGGERHWFITLARSRNSTRSRRRSPFSMLAMKG